MKHSLDRGEYVDISHTLNAEQKALWNILLDHAQENFDQTLHAIDVEEVLGRWSTNKTADDLFCGLKQLAVVISYRFIKSGDQCERGSFFLIDSACIKDGVCQYSYSSMFKQCAHHPSLSRSLLAEQLLFSVA